MKTTALALFLLLFSVTSFSQDLYIPDNPYDKAPEYIKKRNAFNRERWFFEQRMFPNNFIPDNAYKNAQDMRDELRKEQGYYYNNRENMWESVGPTCGTLMVWGNISSRMGTIKVHPTNPNIIFIGGANGGIWKTTNGGLNWMAKSDYQASLSSGAMAIDPANPNIVYYGTGEATYSGVSYYGRGVLKSTDGGDTWVNYTTGLPAQTYFARIIIRPGVPNELLAALGPSGVYRSTNAGQTWSSVYTGKYDDVIFDPAGTKAYINGANGIIISTNGGASFTQTVTGYSAGERNQITISKTNPNILYASAFYSADGTIKVFKSTNGGSNWTQVSASTNFNGSIAWYDFYIYVSPHDENLVYVGSIDTWRSTNGGSSFSNITSAYEGGIVHPDQQNMDFHPSDPNIIYIVNDGGINRSTNKGNTFTNLNAGLTLTQFYRMTSNPANPNQLLGGTQDNGTQQTFGSINWDAAFSGDGGEVCFHPKNTQYVLGETQRNGVTKSTNGGLTWATATTGLTGGAAWIGPIIAHPDSNGIFYTARASLFKSTTWGNNWVAISSGTNGIINELSISKSNPSIIYASVANFIYKSTNRGYTFTNVTNGLPGILITSIAINPANHNDVLLSFSAFGSNRISRTTNGGVNWFNISGNLPDTPVNDIIYYYPGMSTNVYICATDIGVFMSNNLGTCWIELAQGLPNTVAMNLDYNAMSNRLTIGTHGRGVFKLNAALVNVSNVNSSTPDKYSLSQNYPNPFNPVTKIKYDIRQTGMVTLKVYDALGRNVSILVNQNQAPGTYEAIFDASDLTSGIYFYKLESGNYAETKKMMILK